MKVIDDSRHGGNFGSGFWRHFVVQVAHIRKRVSGYDVRRAIFLVGLQMKA